MVVFKLTRQRERREMRLLRGLFPPAMMIVKKTHHTGKLVELQVGRTRRRERKNDEDWQQQRDKI